MPPMDERGRHLSWLIAQRCGRLGIAVVVSAWVARHLGPESFGVLNHALSVVTLGTVVIGLGLDTVLIRELVRQPQRQALLLGSAWALKALGVLVMVPLIALLLMLGVGPAGQGALVVIVATGCLFHTLLVVEPDLQAQHAGKAVALAQFTAALLGGAGKLTAIALDAPLWVFAALMALDMVFVGFSMLAAWWWWRGNPLRWRCSWTMMRYLLGECWPLAISAAAGLLLSRIDQVMLGNLVGAAAVGTYAAAARISESWFMLAPVLGRGLLPSITALAEAQPQQLWLQLQKIYSTLFLVAVVVAMPVSLLAPWLIALLYGAAYVDSAAVLAIHIWAGVFIFLRAGSGSWYLIHHLQRLSMLRALGGVVVNVVANVVLIPQWGVVGAAWALVLGIAWASLGASVCTRATRPDALLQLGALSGYWWWRRWLPGERKLR